MCSLIHLHRLLVLYNWSDLMSVRSILFFSLWENQLQCIVFDQEWILMLKHLRHNSSRYKMPFIFLHIFFPFYWKCVDVLSAHIVFTLMAATISFTVVLIEFINWLASIFREETRIKISCQLMEPLWLKSSYVLDYDFFFFLLQQTVFLNDDATKSTVLW